MHDQDRMFVAHTTIFTRIGQVAKIVMPDGMRMVMLVRGTKPAMCPIEEPGEYEVDIAAILDEENTSFPAAVSVVDLKHIKVWESLSIDVVGRMLDRCSDAAKKAQAHD